MKKVLLVLCVVLAVACTALAEETKPTPEKKDAYWKPATKTENKDNIVKNLNSSKIENDNTIFKNFKFGMTKEEVIKVAEEDKTLKVLWVKRDESISIGLDELIALQKIERERFFNREAFDGHSIYTIVGSHFVEVYFSYYNDKLYQISICSISVEASKIELVIQSIANYFYEVFSKKYGAATYKSTFSNNINASSFKESIDVNVYKWENKEISRAISLTTRDFEYYAKIIIYDNAVYNLKATEDKKKEEDSKNKAIKDF